MKRENLFLFLAAFLWSTSFPVVKWGLSYIDPLPFLYLRFALATIFFIPFFNLSLLKHLYDKKILLIIFFNSAGYVFQFFGQKWTEASRTALFINMYIIWVPFLAYLFDREKLRIKGIFALLFSVLGLVFVLNGSLFSPIPVGNGKNFIYGDILVLFSSLSWGFYIILSKKILDNLSPFNLSIIVISGTFLLLTPFFFFNTQIPWRSPQTIYTVFHLAFFCTFLAYYLYHKGLQSSTPFTSSLFLLLEVIFAVLISVIFLREEFGFREIVGGILIISGIYMGSKNESGRSS